MTSINPQDAGLIVAAYGRRGLIETKSGERLPFIVQGRQIRVVCGDSVDWKLSDDSSLAVITGIRPRKNALVRQPLTGKHQETLAANLSKLVVVCALQPEPDWFLVDRYLCCGELMDCRQLLLINKSDLLDTDTKRQLPFAEYEKIGYQLLFISALNNEGVNSLQDALRNETSALVGQSGVGKSSLINKLIPGTDIVTGNISKATQEGKHTTTASTMHDLPTGGRIIDTPGVRDFIPAISDKAAIQDGFPEFRQASVNCKYSNCLHLREPACGIKKAMEAGVIFKRRYESYKRLLNSLNN